MNRSQPSTSVQVAGDTDERVEVADLAARISARSPRAAEASGNSRRPSRWVQLLLAAAWLITLALTAVALLRFFHHDGTLLLTWLNAFTRYLYLPAYGCLLLALWQKRRWLAAANAGLIACHLWWLAPDFLPDRRFATSAPADSSAEATTTLRIFFANVRFRNDARDALWREIEQADPDVVILVEFMGDWREAYRRSPLSAKYPFNTGLDQVEADNFIFAKSSPRSIRMDWVAGRCVETLEYPLGAETLRIVGLHSPRPMNVFGGDYIGFWQRVLPMLAGERHPLVVVGDFNATQYSRVYADLKSAGLRSAHEDRARGYATTWPNGALPLPPIRIDQAFLSPDVACRAITEGRGTGSDHKPLILDIELRSR